MLLDAGADPTYVRKSDEMTALKFAVKRFEPGVIQRLIDAGAAVDGPKRTRQTALMLAARANNVGSIKVLLENGASVAIKCKLPWADGRNAAEVAELEGQSKAARFLREFMSKRIKRRR
jgi:ankyrin repeat protein